MLVVEEPMETPRPRRGLLCTPLEEVGVELNEVIQVLPMGLLELRGRPVVAALLSVAAIRHHTLRGALDQEGLLTWPSRRNV